MIFDMIVNTFSVNYVNKGEISFSKNSFFKELFLIMAFLCIEYRSYTLNVFLHCEMLAMTRTLLEYARFCKNSYSWE